MKDDGPKINASGQRALLKYRYTPTAIVDLISQHAAEQANIPEGIDHQCAVQPILVANEDAPGGFETFYSVEIWRKDQVN